MVVGLTAQDGHGAIDLFDKKQAHHLMRKGHARKAHLLGSEGVDGWGKTVGAAHNENQTARDAVLALLEPVSGIALPLNRFTAFCAGVLGLPGVTALLILRLLL